jgi:lipoate-protein ligase A
MSAADATCRLLIESAPHRGAWNMAYDEALLDAAAARGETVLRIFRWSEPTLTLGYFQKSLPEDLPDALRALPRVRRLSGGGAILHHHEWTYSCAVPKSHPFAKRTEVLYDEVHRAMIEALGRLGINARLRASTQSDDSFLCFLRGDPRDILVNGRKVVGSAQRRRRGAILQHGSLLLRRSELAPSIPGLADLVAGAKIDEFFAAGNFVDVVSPALFQAAPMEAAHPEDLSFADRNEANYGAP